MSNKGRDPFNQNSDRSDREKRNTSKGGPVFPKLFRLVRTDPLSFGPKFPEILVEWIAPKKMGSWSAGGQHPGDELAVLYTIVQRDLRYTKMAATAAVSFVVF